MLDAALPHTGSESALDAALAPLPKLETRETRYLSPYHVHLPIFEGPLDLLLHLIRKDQVNIYDIPISRICENYMAYIERMDQPDVNLAGEFMVMAATLAHIKSQVLLPREEGENAEDDPRLPLVAQLLEYEKFKLAAAQIDERPWLSRDVFERVPVVPQDLMPQEVLADSPIDSVDPFQLLLGLRAALTRTTRPPLKISLDPVSIKEKVELIKSRLVQSDTLEFRDLIDLGSEHLVKELITSFLAILELGKLRFVEILQHENFGPIHIRATRSFEDLNTSLLDQY